MPPRAVEDHFELVNETAGRPGGVDDVIQIMGLDCNGVEGVNGVGKAERHMLLFGRFEDVGSFSRANVPSGAKGE